MDDFLKVGEDYLAHHGVLGMKWGEQNGPPYPIQDGGHSKSEKEAAKQAGIQVGKDSGFDSIQSLKAIQQSSKSISETVKSFKKGPKHKKRDLSSYSDDELRYEVARRSLEDQYNKLLDNDDYVKSSQYAIDKALDKVGDTAITIGAITGAAVSIATLIKMSKTG